VRGGKGNVTPDAHNICMYMHTCVYTYSHSRGVYLHIHVCISCIFICIYINIHMNTINLHVNNLCIHIHIHINRRSSCGEAPFIDVYTYIFTCICHVYVFVYSCLHHEAELVRGVKGNATPDAHSIRMYMHTCVYTYPHYRGVYLHIHVYISCICIYVFMYT